MEKPMKPFSAGVLGATFAALALMTASARGDVIAEWNERADAIAAEKQLGNVPNARGIAMMHLAMFEAVNAIDPRYAPYKLNLSADRTASKEAAAATAAHAIMTTLHPDQKAKLDPVLAANLSGISEGDAKSKGIDLGRKAAAEVFALRMNDGMEVRESYRPVTTPGVYISTATPIASTVPGLKPFVMGSGSQFRPGPPPGLTSATWTKDLNEIREIGGARSTRRTAEQTDIGRFWFLSGPRTFNPIVRQVAAAKKLDIVDSARLFALSTIAGTDAFIAVFDGKYAYNLWRPVTAIRNADQTGNADAPRDASWTPLGDTPMHPEYPCAHCIVAAAVSTVLQQVAGNEVGEITLTSPTAPGVTRRWTRLSDYRDEVSVARIYAGFHYRFSTEVAKDMGRKIGELTIATQLRPVSPPTR